MLGRRHDVVERLVLEVDQIFHLACPASPVHYKCALDLHHLSLVRINRDCVTKNPTWNA